MDSYNFGGPGTQFGSFPAHFTTERLP